MRSLPSESNQSVPAAPPIPCLVSIHTGFISNDHLNDHIPHMKPPLQGSRDRRSMPRGGRRRCVYQPTPTAYAFGPGPLEAGVVMLVPVLVRGTRMQLRHCPRPLSGRALHRSTAWLTSDLTKLSPEVLLLGCRKAGTASTGHRRTSGRWPEDSGWRIPDRGSGILLG